MTLSEMQKFLAARGIKLTKSLGQNFLHDGNQLRRILALAELTKADKVLEIGPGLGPLTERLLAEAGDVLAIEKDSRLVEALRDRFGHGAPAASDRLRLIHDDALDYLRGTPTDWSGWKVVSNLPYSVGSPILVELALAPSGPARMVVTLQLEVVRRLLAAPSSHDYGILTVLVQLHYQPHDWFKIPAGCFFPAPDVDSGCLCLLRRPQPLLAAKEVSLFVQVVKRSFSQRRKMMLKLLREEWPLDLLQNAFAELNLSPQARAESVTLNQFAALARRLAHPK
jgi:16S rRNA (adenine1518-N6/adenine1519-N6)-dimethyltransferase